MAQILSNAHIEHIINGHRVEGLADEDRPIEFPGDQDMADLSTGQDGGLYGMSNPMLGGPITYRVSPTSPTARWAIQEKQSWRNAIKNGSAITIYEASHSDPVQGRTASLKGGVLLRCPDMVEPGQTFEFVIHYEEIIPALEGATFRAPLSSS